MLTSQHHLILQIIVAALARLVINVARRFVYPFAGALSQGLGVPLTTITPLIALNQGTGVISPLFGPLSDRWGYRFMMLLALGLLALAGLLGGSMAFYMAIALAMFCIGISKSIFDPALQAFVGEHVPYHRRGMAVGLIEFSWAGSALIGLPFLGWLMTRFGWQAAFWAILGFSLLSMLLLSLVLPTPPRPVQTPFQPRLFLSAWRKLATEASAMGVLAFAFLISMANDMLFVVYGVWLTDSFELTMAGVGLGTGVIGLAELGGEGLTAAVSDRLGLPRALMIGTASTAIAYLLLPFIGQTLTGALLALFLVYFMFEFTIVTTISINTELLPEQRATMLSAFMAVGSVGRMMGAIIGPIIWTNGNMMILCAGSAALNMGGLLCLIWAMRRWHPQALNP